MSNQWESFDDSARHIAECGCVYCQNDHIGLCIRHQLNQCEPGFCDVCDAGEGKQRDASE